MTRLRVRTGGVAGKTRVPGDKAVAHRALMLAGLADGRSTIRGLPPGGDVRATARCLQALGVRIEGSEDRADVEGAGIRAWTEPDGPLDCANSATTMRILAGLVSRCGWRTVLDGDDSLRRRPMDRVVEPLRALGAKVSARDGRFPPLVVEGGMLRGTEVVPSVPSGQVKSAVLLAGLGADGVTTVVERHPTRDDTERMLKALGAPVRVVEAEHGSVSVSVEAYEPAGFDLEVPGDVSSAAFLMAAAVLTGDVRIDEVCLNPTRTGFLDVLERMGASLERVTMGERLGEPVGYVEARPSRLEGVRLEGPMPSFVDELPLVALLATQASGRTVVTGAGELRVKESDRVAAVCDGLGRMGARIGELDDGFVIDGPARLVGTEVDAWGDHRIAMMLAVAGLVADGETTVAGFEAAEVTWPGFEQTLTELGAEVDLG